jgi:hypothetical protein
MLADLPICAFFQDTGDWVILKCRFACVDVDIMCKQKYSNCEDEKNTWYY